VIKILEAQVGQFLLGFKCLVSRFVPGRAKSLSATLYPYLETIFSATMSRYTQTKIVIDEKRKVG
jgi:hypothetical protein